MKRKPVERKAKSDKRERDDAAAAKGNPSTRHGRRRTAQRTATERGEESDSSLVEAYSVPQVASSGTLPDHDDTDDLPVTESGLSVQADQLGVQFIRDATEQDNFEGTVVDVTEAGELTFEQLDLEPVVEQMADDLQSSERVPRDGAGEPEEPFDITSESVEEASLFDRSVGDEEDDDALEANDEDPSPLAAATRRPREGAEIDDEAAEAEKRRERERLRRLRPRAHDSVASRNAEATAAAGVARQLAPKTRKNLADAPKRKQRLDEQADEASYESFPASDPPATNAGSIGGNR